MEKIDVPIVLTEDQKAELMRPLDEQVLAQVCAGGAAVLAESLVNTTSLVGAMA